MDIMGIARSLAVLLALFIGSHDALAQEVTVTGRLGPQASSLVGKHYVQAYTVDSRPDKPLRSVQLTAPDFVSVLIVVSPDGTAEFKDDARGEGSVRIPTAPRTGEWLIVVTAYEIMRPGGYSLTVDGPAPRPTSRRLPRAAIALLPFERTPDVAAPVQARVDTVTLTKVDTVTVMRADTVFVTRVDTVTRTRPTTTRGAAPR